MTTFATIIVPAADQLAAQEACPGCFTAAFTTDPTGIPPATHFVSSGWFETEQLEQVCDGVVWARTIRFGEPHSALAALGLVMVQEPMATTAT